MPSSLLTMGVRRGGNGHFPFWDWNQAPRFSRKHEVSSSIPINWLNFCNATVLSRMTLTLHNSQVHFFIFLPKFTVLVSCSGKLAVHSCNALTPLRGQTWERIFSGVGAYCVTVSWQQILNGWLQVTIEGVLSHVAFEHWCHA